MNIGNKIKDLREQNNLTQKQLGEKIGVSAVSITRYEKGERTPGINRLKKIADIFDVDVNYFINYDNFQNLKSNKNELLKNLNIDESIFNKLPDSFQDYTFIHFSDIPLNFLKLNNFLNKLDNEELKKEGSSLYNELDNYYHLEFKTKFEHLLSSYRAIKSLNEKNEKHISELLNYFTVLKDTLLDSIRTLNYNDGTAMLLLECITRNLISIEDENLKNKLLELLNESLSKNNKTLSNLNKLKGDESNGDKEE